MKKQNIDEFIKSKVEESPQFYDKDAEKAKNRIWEQIEPSKSERKIPIFWIRSLAAACVLLIFCSGVLSFLLFNTQKQNAYLALQLEQNNKKDPAIIVTKKTNTIVEIDTVYIEKIIEKPIIREKQIVSTNIIYDTVFVKQALDETTHNPLIAEIDKPLPDSASIAQQAMQLANFEQKLIIIENSEQQKPKKKNIFLEMLRRKVNVTDSEPRGLIDYISRL